MQTNNSIFFLGYFYEIPSIGAIRINTQVLYKSIMIILMMFDYGHLDVDEQMSFILITGSGMTYVFCIIRCIGVFRCPGPTHGPG